MGNPKIVYPSGGGTTLQFVYPPRFLAGDYMTVRHDNRSSAGVQETIWERTDELLTFTMEYVKVGSDITAWDSFVQSALQGIAFDYYQDPVGAPTIFKTYTLDKTTWNASWKQLGMYSFQMRFRKRVGWPAAPPVAGPATSFSDNFDRIDGNTFGPLWAMPFIPTVGRYFKITGNTAEIGNSGSSNDIYSTFVMPLQPVGLMNASTQKAWANYVAVNDVNAGYCYSGVGVLMQVEAGGATNGYFLQNAFDSSVRYIKLRKIDAAATILKDPVANYTLGDKITLAFVVGATSVTLFSYINDVLIDTTVDSTSTRSRQGMPGLGYIGCEASRWIRFDNFGCSP